MTQKDLKLIEVTAKYLDAALEEERKKLIDKACEWLNIHDSYSTPTNVLVEDFRKAMEGN